jgi:hypothetical protein
VLGMMRTEKQKSDCPSAVRLACWMTIALGILLFMPLGANAQVPPTTNSCLDCHLVLDPPLKVAREDAAKDIHFQKGLNCTSCHGGDATNDDPNIAMGRGKGFKGKITRAQVPALCGSCHSNGDTMRKYNPSLRTDQLSLYATSVHGKLFSHGDTKVAVCVDCHTTHTIRPPADTQSTVNPVNVAETCSHCHANADYMKPYSIPTGQFGDYSKSVHHEALAVRGDLSAPTCTTCHGSHGATPPGVASVSAVCSTCHVFQAQLFDASPHKAIFLAMNLPGCVTCHSNHLIAHPTDEMLGVAAGSVCTKCHLEGDAGYQAAVDIHANLKKLEAAIAHSDQILDQAESSGMEVSQARLQQAQGRDALTKARVTIHGAQVDQVNSDIQAGLKVAEINDQAGLAALAERNYRRKGLAVSLAAILLVLIGLRFYIKSIESPMAQGSGDSRS